MMAFTRIGDGLCVANLHASAAREAAERELIAAARAASEWARGTPLVLGGDFNLRPALSGHVFERLDDEFGLAAPTGDRVIDHLLASGLEVVGAPGAVAAGAAGGPRPDGAHGHRPLPIRLSDHAPVEARFSRSDALA